MYLLPNDDDELPNAGVDEAPKAGTELPKAGEGETPKAGVEVKGAPNILKQGINGINM